MSAPANTPSGADVICASAAADIFDIHLCTGEQLGRVAQLFADHWARAQKEAMEKRRPATDPASAWTP
ncbi:MAG: hypothetical protein U1E51_28220 [Candidatus Binatia bacterium]|nr:hypothetical protein [Candidatus Binatia bacterium]